MRHRESHRTEHIGWLRAAVLGANDGLISTSSLIVGVAAAATGRPAVLLAGMVGTLDGGHVVYGLFGQKARKIFPVAIGLLLAFSVLPVILTFSLQAFNFSWLLWVFILFWLGNVRTQPLDDITPLDTKRRVLGFIVLSF